MATRTIKARAAAAGDLLRTVQEYVNNRMMRERSSEAEGTYKAQLMEVLAQSGELREGGHRYLDLEEPISYLTVKGKKTVQKWVTGIQRQKRTSTSLNEDRAMAYLRAHDLVGRCTTTVVVLNEDEILAANYDGTISDADMAGLYDDAVNYAFYLVTEE